MRFAARILAHGSDDASSQGGLFPYDRAMIYRSAATDEVSCGSVHVDRRGLSEVAGPVRLVSIPRARVVRVRFARGFVSEHKALRLAFGVMALLIGTFLGSGAIHVIAQMHIDRISAYMTSAAVFVLTLGVWSCARAVTQGAYLAVHTRVDERRLAFNVPLTDAQADEFIERVRSSCGYVIERDAKD